MANIKAKVSFAGVVTMGKGEIKEIRDDAIVADLVSAGYVEVINAPTETKGKKTTKKGDANEDK